ncbi:hypothetical protein WJX73_009958 [Symbiochloris irregularis]|uniref:30S ribosomal protein S15 n=1 Tax=Symbiochloris irregularis TaxID=706552 RepID=A0AAW1P3W9_9CHLO
MQGMLGCNRPHTCTGFFGTPLHLNAQPAVSRRPVTRIVEARYKGVNTDLAAVPQFKRDGSDTGSSEVQIAQLSARINQLSKHLQKNRKDFSSTRGLTILLGRRKKLLEYVYRTNRDMYESLLLVLKIRPLKIRAARGLMAQLRVPEIKKDITLEEAEAMAPLETVEASKSVDQASYMESLDQA